jgi:hypothetical protein
MQTFGADEIGVQLHHGCIRLQTAMADAPGSWQISWSCSSMESALLGANLVAACDDRSKYTAALRAADEDRNNVAALLKFARS